MADLATINADIDNIDAENNTQAAKIAEAMSLLATKAAGGGGGGDEWEFVGTYTVEQDAVNLYMDFGKVYKKLIISTDNTSLAFLNGEISSSVKYSSGTGGWNNQVYALIDGAISRTAWIETTTLIDFTVRDYPVWIMGAGWQRVQFGKGSVKTNQHGISGCYFTAHDGNKMLNTHVLTVWGVPE